MNNEIDWFKGPRKYIQAADLLLSAWNSVEGIEHFVFSSRKVGTCPTQWIDPAGVTKDAILANFSALTKEGNEVAKVAVQYEGRTITKEIPFPESLMFDTAVIAGPTITCPILPDFTSWEHISSLNKFLMTAIFEHPSWWFVRLEGNKLLSNRSGTMVIRYLEKKRILYRSEISIDGQSAGFVDFAMR